MLVLDRLFRHNFICSNISPSKDWTNDFAYEPSLLYCRPHHLIFIYANRQLLLHAIRM